MKIERNNKSNVQLIEEAFQYEKDKKFWKFWRERNEISRVRFLHNRCAKRTTDEDWEKLPFLFKEDGITFSDDYINSSHKGLFLNQYGVFTIDIDNNRRCEEKNYIGKLKELGLYNTHFECSKTGTGHFSYQIKSGFSLGYAGSGIDLLGGDASRYLVSAGTVVFQDENLKEEKVKKYKENRRVIPRIGDIFQYKTINDLEYMELELKTEKDLSDFFKKIFSIDKEVFFKDGKLNSNGLIKTTYYRNGKREGKKQFTIKQLLEINDYGVNTAIGSKTETHNNTTENLGDSDDFDRDEVLGKQIETRECGLHSILSNILDRFCKRNNLTGLRSLKDITTYENGINFYDYCDGNICGKTEGHTSGQEKKAHITILKDGKGWAYCYGQQETIGIKTYIKQKLKTDCGANEQQQNEGWEKVKHIFDNKKQEEKKEKENIPKKLNAELDLEKIDFIKDNYLHLKETGHLIGKNQHITDLYDFIVYLGEKQETDTVYYLKSVAKLSLFTTYFFYVERRLDDLGESGGKKSLMFYDNRTKQYVIIDDLLAFLTNKLNKIISNLIKNQNGDCIRINKDGIKDLMSDIGETNGESDSQGDYLIALNPKNKKLYGDVIIDFATKKFHKKDEKTHFFQKLPKIDLPFLKHLINEETETDKVKLLKKYCSKIYDWYKLICFDKNGKEYEDLKIIYLIELAILIIRCEGLGHSIFFLRGEGGRGKSTFIEGTLNLLYDGISSLVKDVNLQKTHNANTYRYAGLEKAGTVIVQEMNKGSLDTDEVKRLTSDSVQVVYKYRNSFSIYFKGAIISTQNTQSYIDDIGTSMIRRYKELVFRNENKKYEVDGKVVVESNIEFLKRILAKDEDNEWNDLKLRFRTLQVYFAMTTKHFELNKLKTTKETLDPILAAINYFYDITDDARDEIVDEEKNLKDKNDVDIIDNTGKVVDYRNCVFENIRDYLQKNEHNVGFNRKKLHSKLRRHKVYVDDKIIREDRKTKRIYIYKRLKVNSKHEKRIQEKIQSLSNNADNLNNSIIKEGLEKGVIHKPSLEICEKFYDKKPEWYLKGKGKLIELSKDNSEKIEILINECRYNDKNQDLEFLIYTGDGI